MIRFPLAGPKDTLSYEAERGTIAAKQKLDNSVLGSQTPFSFEITKGFHDTVVQTQNNKYEWVGKYTVTMWDTGYFMFPPASLRYRDSTFEIPPKLVYVSMDAYDPNVDPLEVTELFAELPDEPFSLGRFLKNNWYWFVIPLVLFLAWFIRRQLKISRSRPKLQKEMSLRQRTLFAIDALEKRKLWESGRLKEHFTELSAILRMYLTSRYNESFLEKTSMEAAESLRRQGLEGEVIDTIRFIFSNADMVKFAKSQPDESEILKVTVLARQIIAETSPIEFEND